MSRPQGGEGGGESGEEISMERGERARGERWETTGRRGERSDGERERKLTLCRFSTAPSSKGASD